MHFVTYLSCFCLMKDDSEHVVQCITALNTSLREHKYFQTLFREDIFFCSFLYMSLSKEVSGMQKAKQRPILMGRWIETVGDN